MTHEIETKLDALAEFYAQRDLLELNKRALLDEVKVPAEIEQIVADGMRAIQKQAADERAGLNANDLLIDEELKKIVIPEEIKTALAEIDRQRAEIMDRKIANADTYEKATAEFSKKIQADIKQKTADVYRQIEQRKTEIEVEFSGKAEDVNDNIRKLEAEIKADVKAEAARKLEANPKSKDLSVKGNFFHAVYVKARKTWIPAKLDDYVETHPDIKNCYTEGEPSITLRKI